MMPSVRASRYPLRSHDLPMNSDLFTTSKASAASDSGMLDSCPQSNMPSLTNHGAQDYYYTGKPYHDGGAFVNSKAFVEWQNLQDSITSLQNSDHYQMSQGYSSLRFESTGEQSVWNCNSLNGAALEYSSMMCPRSYPLEGAVDKKILSEPESQIHPPPSYVIEAQEQRINQAVTDSRHPRADVFTVPGGDMYRSDYGAILDQSGSSGSPHSALRTIKTEFPITTGSNLTKRSDETFSPSTMIENVSPPTVINSLSPPRINSFFPPRMMDKSPPPTLMDDESDGYGSANAEPYAQLIYRALKSAPAHAMVLKEIYEWFENNTDKAKNGSSKGWQNSIRHNLSMNGAFKKEDQPAATDESKKGFIWVLEQSALVEGVRSTTRYRKHNASKKIGKPEAPAPLRQRSGAKGGKAARKAAKMRRSTRMNDATVIRYIDEHFADVNCATTIENKLQRAVDTTLFCSETMPYYLHSSNPQADSLAPESPYGYSSITGCAPASPIDPLFYESLEKCNDSMLSCDSFCDSEDSLLHCGLGCMS